MSWREGMRATARAYLRRTSRKLSFRPRAGFSRFIMRPFRRGASGHSRARPRRVRLGMMSQRVSPGATPSEARRARRTRRCAVRLARRFPRSVRRRRRWTPRRDFPRVERARALDRDRLSSIAALAPPRRVRERGRGARRRRRAHHQHGQRHGEALREARQESHPPSAVRLRRRRRRESPRGDLRRPRRCDPPRGEGDVPRRRRARTARRPRVSRRPRPGARPQKSRGAPIRRSRRRRRRARRAESRRRGRARHHRRDPRTRARRHPGPRKPRDPRAHRPRARLGRGRASPRDVRSLQRQGAFPSIPRLSLASNPRANRAFLSSSTDDVIPEIARALSRRSAGFAPRSPAVLVIFSRARRIPTSASLAERPSRSRRRTRRPRRTSFARAHDFVWPKTSLHDVVSPNHHFTTWFRPTITSALTRNPYPRPSSPSSSRRRFARRAAECSDFPWRVSRGPSSRRRRTNVVCVDSAPSPPRRTRWTPRRRADGSAAAAKATTSGCVSCSDPRDRVCPPTRSESVAQWRSRCPARWRASTSASRGGYSCISCDDDDRTFGDEKRGTRNERRGTGRFGSRRGTSRYLYESFGEF